MDIIVMKIFNFVYGHREMWISGAQLPGDNAIRWTIVSFAVFINILNDERY